MSDKARVTTSTSFRRLQTKAQVFSLEQNAGVRTRLTHTLEVATYGELIAEKAFELLLENRRLEEELRQPFVTSVENACLLHDIGNPPFGHLGEYAIRRWFSDSRAEITQAWRRDGVTDADVERFAAGFEHFDGNAQSLRIVSRLQWLTDEFGLNLTCTLIASIVKYLDSRPGPSAFGKKTGFFESERDRVLEVWKQLRLAIADGAPAQRHPLTFIMEAADDISYSVSDIEDALEKRIITEDRLLDNIPSALAPFVPSKKSIDGRVVAKNARFVLMKTMLARYLVDAAAEAFADQDRAIRDGTFKMSLLDVDPQAREARNALTDFAKEHIYTSDEAIHIELSGQRIIREILTELMPIVVLKREMMLQLHSEAKNPPKRAELAIERRLYQLLPHKHRIVYETLSQANTALEPVFRTHLVVDYLAGMTDSHAVKVFGMLSGTEASSLV